jgi:hypothetical protein
MTPDVRCLLLAKSHKPLKKRNLPGKELDDLHAAKKLLQELGPFICPHHAFRADREQMFHYDGLQWRCYHKDCKTSYSTGPKIDDEQNETENQLDRRCPGLGIHENGPKGGSKQDFTMWKKPAQKSMRETSVEM